MFALLSAAALALTPPTGTFRMLAVGGGPEPRANQAAIESNLRYLHRILPPSLDRHVLFADGRRDTPSVMFQTPDGRLFVREPELPEIDGPTTQAGLEEAWRGFVQQKAREPLLLYFTGHGIRNRRGDLDNNIFQLWGGGDLTVRDLAAHIAGLPRETRVVVVMAQCFSGSFANLIFEGARPDGRPVDRDLAGFFAATADRTATGCTPEINEAEYRDFTSYFFAALSGRDRQGRRVSGADFDGDQRVGMDEAFAYAQIHQVTSDVPVSTSDAFLRRFVPQPDTVTMATPYTSVLAWATPAQRAALEGLSARLRLNGEGRLAVAYDAQFGRARRLEPEITRAYRLRFIRTAKSVVLAHVLQQTGERALVDRFARLRAAEAQNPLRGMAEDAARMIGQGPRGFIGSASAPVARASRVE